MPIIALLLAATPASIASPGQPPCRAEQVRLSVDGRDGEFNGMSHSGVELSIRNIATDCQLPGIPVIEFRDAQGRLLSASRQTPIGMHPGPVILPVRIAGGQSVSTAIRWVSGPVFAKSRSVRAGSIGIRVGTQLVKAPLKAILFGSVGKPVLFEQQQLHPVEQIAPASSAVR